MSAMRITDRIDLLGELVESCGDRSIIIIIAGVDFDAIASALGLYHVLRSYGGHPAIYYAGHFSLRHEDYLNEHYQLNKLVRPLKELKLSSNEAENEAKYRFALVDSCSAHDDRLGDFKDRFVPDIVIDHHEKHDLVQRGLQFLWIDTDVGAASTLIIELLRRLELLDTSILDSRDVHLLALLLSLGIYTDTQRMRLTHDRDVVAFKWIAQYMHDAHELSRELDRLIGELRHNTQQVTVAFAEALQRQQKKDVASPRAALVPRMHAIVSPPAEDADVMQIRDVDILFVSLGMVKPNALHDVSVVADHLLAQHAEVNLVIVCGVIDVSNPDVKITVRARPGEFESEQEFDLFLKEMFGRGAGGKLLPGGLAAGGAMIPLSQIMKTSANNKKPSQQNTIVLRHVSDRMKRISKTVAVVPQR